MINQLKNSFNEYNHGTVNHKETLGNILLFKNEEESIQIELKAKGDELG